MKKAINSTREKIEVAVNSSKLIVRIVIYIVSGVMAGTLLYASLDHRVETNTKSIKALECVDVDINDDLNEVEKSLIRQEEQNIWIRASLEKIEKKLDR